MPAKISVPFLSGYCRCGSLYVFLMALLAGLFQPQFVQTFTIRQNLLYSSSSARSILRTGPEFQPLLAFSSFDDNVSVKHLLYQDQQEAMLRRAAQEQVLLEPNLRELLAPGGGGFGNSRNSGAGSSGGGGSSSTNKKKINKNEARKKLALQQAQALDHDGVVRINKVMSTKCVDRLRLHVLEQQAYAARTVQDRENDVSLQQTFYGVENQRKFRCDLQLSLLKGGYAADRNNNNSDNDSTNQEEQPHNHPVADALQELLGAKDGTLRSLYEQLVTTDGEFYELACVITDPGSDRQVIHPDLPFRATAPLYVVFLALQDVTREMGPTTFLLGTHTADANRQFSSNDESLQHLLLSQAQGRLATLKKGDAVVFDARLLHCGNANVEKTRAMFNFSFRSPKQTGNLGYAGSIRPGYVECGLTLGTIGDALLDYPHKNLDPFSEYGDGVIAPP